MPVSRKVDCELVMPEAEDSVHEGCPILTKRRHLIVDKGQCGRAQWQMRFRDGTVADLSDCFPDSESLSESNPELGISLKARFQGCDRSGVLATVDATVENAEAGLVQFDLPASVVANAGIYVFQVAIVGSSDEVVFADGGILSVEHGLWGNTASQNGPPTLQTIRFAIRDRAVENDLLQDVEFDDAEILEAIRQPIMQFNELPPPIQRFTCNNFPYRYHWRNAIIGELLKVAVHHYVRNKMKTQGTGLTVDDKNKDAEYYQLAAIYDREWKEFIVLKKMEINLTGFYGTLGSTYGY